MYNDKIKNSFLYLLEKQIQRTIINWKINKFWNEWNEKKDKENKTITIKKIRK